MIAIRGPEFAAVLPPDCLKHCHRLQLAIHICQLNILVNELGNAPQVLVGRLAWGCESGGLGKYY